MALQELDSSESRQGEYRRMRLGLIVLLAGLFVLLAALGMMMLRAPTDALTVTPSAAAPVAVQRDAADAARMGMILMVIGFLLVICFLVAAYLLFRVSRRYTQRLLDPPPSDEPTPIDDVWSMGGRKTTGGGLDSSP